MICNRGHKVGKQRSPIINKRHTPPKRQNFPKWMIADELAKVEAIKKRGELVCR